MGDKRERWRVKKPKKAHDAEILTAKLIALRLLIIALFGVLAMQLWNMQIVQGKQYQQRAENNRLRLLSIPPPRGVIYDRDGQMLARNLPSFTAAIVPADLPVEKQDDVAARLAPLLDMDVKEINDLVNERRDQHEIFTPAPIKERISKETAFILEERDNELPGVQVLIDSSRQYEEGMSISHILGYVGRIDAQEYARLKSAGYEPNDRLGKMGVEYSYEDQLRGKPGKEQIEVNALGRKVATLDRVEPQPGNNLVLTLDLDLQKKMTELVMANMGQSQHAVAIALNPKTGEVLGMVSLPTYDNNVFSNPLSRDMLNQLLEDPRHPLFNSAISANYPPGSIFKIVTGLAALQEGVATAATRIFSSGMMLVPNQYDPSIVYRFPDWAALGWLDFYQAIARSSDIYFYWLAGGFESFKGLGAERLAKYAKIFGLGQKTGIDLPGESPGLVPDPNWKMENMKEPWVAADTYHFGIGQGLLTTTPLQMANIVATVANGGTIMKPRIVREIKDPDGNVIVPFSPEPAGELPISKANIDIMREGMRQAVDWGTATAAKLPGVTVAGKTGTAEYGVVDPKTGVLPSHAWFLSFAPFDDPEIAVAVFLEVGNGAYDAAPLGAKILRYYFERSGKIAPEKSPATATPPPTGPKPR